MNCKNTLFFYIVNRRPEQNKHVFKRMGSSVIAFSFIKNSLGKCRCPISFSAVDELEPHSRRASEANEHLFLSAARKSADDSLALTTIHV